MAPDAPQDFVFFPLERHDVVAQAKVFHLAALGLHLLGQLGNFVTDLHQGAAAGIDVSVVQLAGVGCDQRVDQRCSQRRIGAA